ncbi:MaoC/PaaZ C-terminal domain-containing protein [Haloglomus salinum]|jgi:acyl dehydratase|uniref:MaoC/PaaZ C-terminal domain-containing protein n=1 Tax=Haloglomus salinum TaxID=2962673 RepID=UPI0020C9ECA8|nr:MaoC/PaaZ C-terminal domain-containing protein [Haloglomus salinum]
MTDTDDGDDYSIYANTEEGDTDTTGGRTITEADIANFAGVSGDFNHLHMDEEAMQESMFGERIAHGMLVFSAATGLLWQNRTPEERDAVVAFYGIDDLRFRGPVFAGDTIHVEAEVVEKRESDNPAATGTIQYDVEVVKQDGSTAISCSMLSLVE